MTLQIASFASQREHERRLKFENDRRNENENEFS